MVSNQDSGNRRITSNTIKRLMLVALGTTSAFFMNATAQELPFDPQVRTGKLANGLTYYIRQNKIPEKRAELYLVNKVGSILEDENQLGLAHFVEHMAFNGTRDFPKNTLVDFLQKAGVKFGADINAYTAFDETVYQLPIPSDTAAIFEKGFDILLNWAGFVSFDTAEINAERGVILEEARLRGKNAMERIQHQILPVIFNKSRYAERLPIGKEEILKTFTPETIRKFYKDWYRPDLQAVIAVGDFDPDKVEAMIREKFSVLTNPATPRPRVSYSVPPHEETFTKIVTDKEFPYTVVEILQTRNAEPLKTVGQLREMIRKDLFNTMMSNRLTELGRRPDAPFFFAQNMMTEFMAGLQSYISLAVVKNGQIEAALAVLREEEARVRKFGFTQSELDRAITDVKAKVESGYKEKDKTKSASYVAAYQSHFLLGNAAPGADFRYRFYTEELPKITLADVNGLLNTFSDKYNRVVLIQAPSKDSAALPSADKLLAWVDKDRSYVTAYEDKTSDKPLLAKKPVGTKRVASKAFPAIDAELITLGNGVKIWLKSTTFKNDEILLSGYSFGGTSLVADKDIPSALFVNSIIDESGVGEFDITGLSKKIAGKNVSVSPFITETTEGVSARTTPADLEAALQLVYLYYTAPRKDTLAFRTQIQQYKELLRNRNLDPTSVFSDTLIGLLNNYSPRRMTPDLKTVNKVNADKLMSIYKDRFADAGDAVFVVVGAFRRDSILPLLETYLGALPATGRKESFRNLGIRPVPGQVTRRVYKGQEEKSSVQLVFSGNYTYNENNNLNLDALTEILQIKITERLREKEGGAYSPGVSSSYTSIPEQRYSISIEFGCAPENVDKLIAATLDEIRKIRTNGPEEDDLRKFIAEETRAMELRLKENGFWLNYLTGQSQRGESVLEVNSYTTRLKNVNKAAVKTAAENYLNGKNLIRAILLPEKK